MSSQPTSEVGEMVIMGARAIGEVLTYDVCIPLMRTAMSALSAGHTLQLLRTHIDLGDGRIFGIMPGALARHAYFGAKLVSVFEDQERPGRSAHRGVVVLFDGKSGGPLCAADAEQVTAIRTASTSAMATDVLARRDASVLTVLGCGRQAEGHVHAISRVRALRHVRIWGRSLANAVVLAKRLAVAIAVDVEPMPDAAAAVADADIICTTTAAAEPILSGCWVRPGAHINLVGSSGPAAAEADNALVRAARYFVDSRESALAKAGEFLRAKAAGAVTDEHIVGEIGDVLLGRCQGRIKSSDITVYKSLGHVVQDLAATAYLYQQVAGGARTLTAGMR